MLLTVCRTMIPYEHFRTCKNYSKLCCGPRHFYALILLVRSYIWITLVHAHSLEHSTSTLVILGHFISAEEGYCRNASRIKPIEFPKLLQRFHDLSPLSLSLSFSLSLSLSFSILAYTKTLGTQQRGHTRCVRSCFFLAEQQLCVSFGFFV